MRNICQSLSLFFFDNQATLLTNVGQVGCRPVPTAFFNLLYGLVILTHEWQQLSDFRRYRSFDSRMAGDSSFPLGTPHHAIYLLRDRDAAFSPAYTRRVHAMGIRIRPVGARSPWRNGHFERLTGLVRLECLDHVIVLDEAHLRRVLKF